MAAPASSSSSSLPVLPKAVLGHMFSFLALRDAARCLRASKEWYTAMETSSVRFYGVDVRLYGADSHKSPLWALVSRLYGFEKPWSLASLDAFPRLEHIHATSLPRATLDSYAPIMPVKRKSAPLRTATFSAYFDPDLPKEDVAAFVRAMQTYEGAEEIELELHAPSLHADLKNLDALHMLNVHESNTYEGYSESELKIIWSLKQLKKIWFDYSPHDKLIKQVFAPGHPLSGVELAHPVGNNIGTDVYPLLPGRLRFRNLKRDKLSALPADRTIELQYTGYDVEYAGYESDGDQSYKEAYYENKSAEDCAHLTRLSELTSLHITGAMYTSAQLRIALGNMSKLKTLILMDASKLDNLAFLEVVPQLTELGLHGKDNALPTSEAVHIRALKHLETVGLSRLFIPFEARLRRELIGRKPMAVTVVD